MGLELEIKRSTSGLLFCLLQRTSAQLNCQQKRFCFPRLPRVVAGFEALHENHLCLSRHYLCSAAMPGRSKRERLGAFLGHFLPRSKKWHKKRYTERAKLCEAVGEVV